MTENEIAKVLVNIFLKVHRKLGPGLLKSVEIMSATFPKILLTYLRVTNLKLGLLVNFNVDLIKYGIKRIANNLLRTQRKKSLMIFFKLCGLKTLRTLRLCVT